MDKVIPTNNINKNRLYFIDNIKAFAMLLIIWGHCGLIHDFPNFNNWIYSFHVPIFFLISGYLIAVKKNVTNLFFPKFRLLIPYFVYSIIYASITVLLSLTSGLELFITNLKESIIRIFLFDGLIATWYIPCLIVAELIYWIEQKKIKSLNCEILNFIISLIVCLIPIPEEMLIAKIIFRIFPALLCFSTGVLISNYKKNITPVHLIILSLIILPIVAINGNTNLYAMDTGKYAFIYSIEIVLSSIVVFYFFEKFISRKIKLFTWFGQNTLIILGTHQSVIYLLYPIINHFNIRFPKFIPSSIVLTVIVIIIEIPIILIINKWFKWTLGKTKNS